MSRQRSQKRRDRPYLPAVPGSNRKRELRALLRSRDGSDCFYCLRPMLEDASLEHVEDWSVGGSFDLVNLVLAHRACNWAAKGLTVHQKMLRRGDALLALMQQAKKEAA